MLGSESLFTMRGQASQYNIVGSDKKGDRFTIEPRNNSADNCYIKGAVLNGKEHNSYKIPHSVLTAGGTLVLTLDSTPNKEWVWNNYPL